MDAEAIEEAIKMLKLGATPTAIAQKLGLDKREIDRMMREVRRKLAQKFAEYEWEADIMKEWERLEFVHREYLRLYLQAKEIENFSLQKRILDSLAELPIKKMTFLQKIGVLAPDVMFSMQIFNTKIGSINLAKIDYSLEKAREMERTLNLDKILVK